MVDRVRRGFTLYEMIVVFIVASILSLIGVSVMRATAAKLHRTDAEGAVQQVIEAELRFAAIHGAFTSWPGDLPGVDRSITVLDTASVEPGEVSIAVGVDGTLGVASLAADGFCVVRQIQPVLDGAQITSITLAAGAACDGRSGLPVGEAPVLPQSFE